MFSPYTNCLPPFSLSSWCWLLKLHTRERKALNLITWRCLTKEDKKKCKARYLGDLSWNFPRHFTVKKCKKNCLVPNLSVAANAARTRIKLYFLRRLVQLKSSVWRKSASASWSYFGWIHLMHGGLAAFTADLSKSTEQLRDQPERDWRRDWSPAVCPSLPYQ